MLSMILTGFYIIGIVQGITLSIALLRKKILKVKSNQIMLTLLISISTLLAFFCATINGVKLFPRFLGPFSTAAWFATGPLFYLYTLSLISPSFKFEKWQILFFIFPIYNLIQIFLGLANIHFSLKYLFLNGVTYGYFWLMAYIIHSVLFLSVSLVQLKKRDLSNLKILYLAFVWFIVTLIVAFVGLIIITNPTVFFGIIEKILALIFAFFVIFIALKSMSSSFSNEPIDQKKEKYYNTVIPEKRYLEMDNILKQVMITENPYLNRDLSLSDLSKISSIKENELSQFFNQFLKIGFYEFIKEFRLNEVEKRLKNPENKNLKIASIAEDSGFKSRALFYKAFKEKHGLTPTQYLKNIKDQ